MLWTQGSWTCDNLTITRKMFILESDIYSLIGSLLYHTCHTVCAYRTYFGERLNRSLLQYYMSLHAFIDLGLSMKWGNDATLACYLRIIVDSKRVYVGKMSRILSRASKVECYNRLSIICWVLLFGFEMNGGLIRKEMIFLRIFSYNK